LHISRRAKEMLEPYIKQWVAIPVINNTL
jgi:hypothetical protein